VKLSLINKLVCPPEPYFRYVFPEDGYAASGATYDSWITQAGMHSQANNMSAPSHEDMEHQLCLTLPPGWCNYDDNNRVRPSTNLGWDDLQRGLATLGRWLGGGKKAVDQEEADRRALICSRCYLNVQISGCAGCQRLVAELVGGRSSKYDFALKGCAVCKCVLRAKVHVPQEILDKESEALQEVYPSFCWLRKDGENHLT
jgi:hypothetical protein